MKTWSKIGLSVTPKAHIFEDHAIESMQAVVIRPNILLSCTTNMVHVRTDTHKASGTKSRITSLNIRLSIKHHTQGYRRRRKNRGEKGSSVQKKDATKERIEKKKRSRSAELKKIT